jgi:hypothetical protein
MTAPTKLGEVTKVTARAVSPAHCRPDKNIGLIYLFDYLFDEAGRGPR